METRALKHGLMAVMMTLQVFCTSCNNNSDDNYMQDLAEKVFEAKGHVIQAIEDAIIPICDEKGAPKSHGIWVFDMFGNYFVSPSDAMTGNRFYVMDGDKVEAIEADSIIKNIDYFIVAKIDTSGVSALKGRGKPIEAYYAQSKNAVTNANITQMENQWLFGLGSLTAPQGQVAPISRWLGTWPGLYASIDYISGTFLVLGHYESVVNVIGFCTLIPSNGKEDTQTILPWQNQL